MPPFAPEAAVPAEPPVSNRRSRALGALPVWVVVGLGLVAVIAGLLIVPSVIPWSRAPVESPLDDPVPEVGAIGNQTPATASAEASPGTGATSEPTAGPTTTRGPGGPTTSGAPAPTTTTTAPTESSPGPSEGLEVGYFTAAPLPGNEGYRVTVQIANRRTVPQVWQNVAVDILDWSPLPLEVEEPQGTVRAFPALGRVCLTPTNPDTASIEAGQSLTIVFRMNARVSNSPRPVRLNEPGCLSAES
ncbi:MAG: hypothetical protein IRY85_04720 [Micromonosporaceae bacterium]|nr:hypothetical protein [Micromonosporaceae bacterium]